MANTENAVISEAQLLEKNVEMSLLLDFYGDILSDKQREAMTLYYNEDLSLSEISSLSSLTRQGVRDRIVKASGILKNLEDKLHLASRFRDAKEDADALIEKLEKLKLNGTVTDSTLDEAIAAAKRISENL